MSRYFHLGLSIFLFCYPLQGEILKLNAQRVYYQNSTLVAEGNVTLRYKGFVLKGQKLVYNRINQTVEVRGKVFITNNSTIFIHAKSGKYNLSTGEVDLTLPKGRVDKYSFYAAFAKFVNGTLVAKNVCASKCSDFQAEVCAKKFVFSNKEKEGTAYNGLIKVEKIPVLYTPYYHFTTRRKSGFLPPTLGFDSYNEFIYQQPLYLVIDQYSDITLTADYRTGGLKGLGLEFRKYFSFDSYLKTNNYFYYDTAYPNLWWEGRNYHRKNRYLLSGEGYTGNVYFGWEYPSDKDFYYDIFFNKRELHYRSFTKNYVGYLIDNSDYLLDLRTVYFYNLATNERKKDLALAPDLFFYKKPAPIGNGFSWDFTSEVTNFYRNETSFIRWRVETALKKGIVFGSTPVELELKPFANYYSSKRYGNAKHFEGVQFKASALLYDLDLVETENTLWQSLIETEYKFQPFKEKPTPSFDVYDEFTRKNIILLRNLNRVFYKDLQVAEVTVEQPYNLYRGYNFPTDGYFVPKHLMPLKVIYSLGNKKLYATIDGKVYYDYNLKSIFYQSNTLKVYPIDKDFTKLTLKGGYVLSKDHLGRRKTEQYKTGFEFSYKKVNLKGDTFYDKILEKVTSQKISIEYKRKCWSLSLSYERDYNRDGDTYNWRVFLTLNIFGRALNALLAGGRQ